MTLSQVVAVPTWVGLVRWVVSSSPSWPEALEPQHHRVASVRVAQVCSSPAAKPAQGASVPSLVGTVGVAPWPELPSPHHDRAPAIAAAQVPAVKVDPALVEPVNAARVKGSVSTAAASSDTAATPAAERRVAVASVPSRIAVCSRRITSRKPCSAACPRPS